MDVNIVDGVKWYLVFLFSTCCHEAAHACTAYRLGDDTAYRGGQVTLDPTPHVRREPFGMVVLPILSFFLGGWMIGWASTPYSPEWAMRYPRRSAWMGLAGPAANLLLVLTAALLMRVGCEWGVFRSPVRGGFLNIVTAIGPQDGAWAFIAKMLSLLFALNLLLGIFNLLPVPPLDGSTIPLLMLSERWAETYRVFLRQPMVSWMGLLFGWRVFGAVFPSIFHTSSQLLHSFMPGR